MSAGDPKGRIGIDAHYLGSKAGGNETYTRNLLRGLLQIAPELDLLALVNLDEAGQPHPAEDWPTAPIPYRSAYLRVPVALPMLARKHGLDLLHLQYTAPPIMRTPYIVTMHDIVAFTLPASMPPMDRYRLRLLTRMTLKNARGIFTVTEAMRQSISDFFQIDPQRITVTPNALAAGMVPVTDEALLTSVRKRYGIRGPYLLYLGLIQPRKNIARAATAFAKLVKQGYPHQLVIAGRKAWLYEETMAQIEALQLGDRVVFTEYVAQADLPTIYSGADLFLFPSLYEGFGIPVIEALACGTPVLASTDPALVEVAGGGALHVDPLDVDGMSEGMARLLEDAALRGRLVAQGGAHVRRYTVARMAEAALSGYRVALGS